MLVFGSQLRWRIAKALWNCDDSPWELKEMVERMGGAAPGPESLDPRTSAGEGQPVAGSDPAEPSSAAKAAEPFDLQAGITHCFCDYEIFRKLVALFFEEAEPLCEQMQRALDAGDGVELARAAHRLKGTVAYLGAQPTADAASRMEAIAMSGCLENAAEALDQLARELQRLKPALLPHLNLRTMPGGQAP